MVHSRYSRYGLITAQRTNTPRTPVEAPTTNLLSVINKCSSAGMGGLRIPKGTDSDYNGCRIGTFGTQKSSIDAFLTLNNVKH